MKLTIAIPTYNRAKRLEKALFDLCHEIISATNKLDVSVFVSNNGSMDDTEAVIMRYRKLFIESGIPFTSIFAESNQGFDANIIACYTGSNSEYVWFLSDDDNIIAGAVDAILDDIKKHHPSVIYYNHDQKPYDKAQLYIKESEYFDQIADKNIIALQKIINWPKLTALVIRKSENDLLMPTQDLGFAHVSLALQCGLTVGGVLHSPTFTAYPDDDYKEHIDFVPYIGNNLNKVIRWALQANNKMFLYDLLAIPDIDPFISSLNTLGAYYRGKHTLSLPIKQELWKTVHHKIGSGWLKRLMDWKSVKEIVKFPLSIIYGVGHTIITGKRLAKLRHAPSDI
jgi:glycosyltransferase involved in cell wall biosynthesis